MGKTRPGKQAAITRSADEAGSGTRQSQPDGTVNRRLTAAGVPFPRAIPCWTELDPRIGGHEKHHVIGRAILIGLLIAGLEVLQGILRVRFLNRRLGDHRARQVGVLFGSLTTIAVAWWFNPWIGAMTWSELFGVGIVWLLIMSALDLMFGRWVFRFSWKRICRDFDVRQGGLLGIGMLVVLLAPWLASLWR